MFQNNRRLLPFLAAVLLFLNLLPLGAEVLSNGEGVYILSAMAYETDKYTREEALVRELNIPEGKRFDSFAALDEYLADKAQDLVNLRVFEDVTYRLELLGDSEGEKRFKATIIVDGAWTLYPIPYPKYDSNTGFRGGLKVYYSNFFGTLTDFYLGMNIDLRPDGDGWEIPQWSINPELGNISLFGQDFALSLMQRYQESSKYNDEDELYVERYNYYSTDIEIKTTLRLPHSLSYSFAPKFAFFYGYQDQLPDNGSGIVEEDMKFSFSHSLGWGNIDWIGNFRRGIAVSLSNSLAYVTEEEFEGTVKSSISGTLRFFYPWHILNPSIRLRGLYSFTDELSGQGGGLRGIRDDSLYGIYGGFLNTSLNVSVIRWKGVGEALFQPFFDMGMMKREGISFDKKYDIKYGAGADFILYLDKLKGLVARGSIGIDLGNPDWSDGRKYEIVIESSLLY